MANLKETAQWEPGIYQIEQTDPVVGGADGISNVQARQLGNRTAYLKEQVEAMGATVEAFDPSMQAGIFAGLQMALDMAALAMREHDQTRKTRFQELTAVIKNRGVKTGVSITKSTTATRNITVSNGTVFMGGREYPVANQANTASIASNTTDAEGVVIIYMFLTSSGVIDVAATVLNGELPDGAIELARARVPAGNTEASDPYLGSVAITDTARREPMWPAVQAAPAYATVSLNRTLPDNEYLVDVEILSAAGGSQQLGEVYAADKLKNGFKVLLTGTADDVNVRLLVQRPEI